MYTPSQKTLDAYADVMVNFALNKGKGIKKGDTVYLAAHEAGKPLYMACRRAITRAGGNTIGHFMPNEDVRTTWCDKEFFSDVQSPKQLSFFPKHFLQGLINDIDHYLYILSVHDIDALKGVDPKDIMERQKIWFGKFLEMRSEKENAGKLTWSLCLYGTDALAREAGMGLAVYWKEIERACMLDKKDPAGTWKALYREMEVYRKKLSAITTNTKAFHIEGPDADLWITPGEKRKWVCAGGANIPSYEIYTSPDKRGTEGWIRFNQPLYFNGAKIEGVALTFKKGRVVEAKAKKGEKVLKEMIATKNADMVGEFSLTDAHHSRITKFMANTLYDENVGGAHGNTHLALGNSYVNTCTDDIKRMSKKQFEALGYNFSAVHTDIMSTAPRTVTAHLKDGSTRIVYDNGHFTL